MLVNWRAYSPLDVIFILLSYAMIILIALPVHELAHAFAADWMGDDRKVERAAYFKPACPPRYCRDVDDTVFPVWVRKPVPVNPRNFREYKKA